MEHLDSAKIDGLPRNPIINAHIRNDFWDVQRTAGFFGVSCSLGDFTPNGPAPGVCFLDWRGSCMPGKVLSECFAMISWQPLHYA